MQVTATSETDFTGLATSYIRDAASNLAGAANNSVAYSFGYDTLNRLSSKTGSRGRSLSFTWDAAGHMLTKTTFQNSTTSYTYDGAGTLVAAGNPDYLTVNYQYDNAGRILSRVMSSGNRSVYAYDAGGWLTGMSHQDSTGAVVSAETFTRDHVGNITGLNTTAGASTGASSYTLDALYRLTAVNAPTTANSEAFSYDHLGNRITNTKGGASIGATGSTTRYYNYYLASQTGNPGYTATFNNRLKDIRIGSASGTLDSTFIFDNEGRLTSQTGTSPRTITWDAKGRVHSLGAETYRYDTSNHRIGRSGGALGNLDYYLEGEHLESVENSGVLQERYFRGASIDELVAGYTMQNGTMTPVLFAHDQVMSVVVQAPLGGGTQALRSFSAFGMSLTTVGAAITRMAYTGREDDGTGLYYYRARYYNPAVGQFASEDPKRFAAGANFLAYVVNNPVNYFDPSGFDQTCQCSALTFSAVGPNQAVGIGALRISPPNDSVAVNPAIFGLPYDTIPNRVATQNALIKNIPNVRINAPGLSDYLDGGTTFTIGDVGDKNIRNSPQPRFDIYRFETQNDALGFGKQTVPGTITGVPDNWSCPATCTAVPSSLPSGGVTPPAGNAVPTNFGPQSQVDPGAAGGFLLYPNKPNTNQIQSVYSK